METLENFKTYVASIEKKDAYQKPLAFALGIRRTKGDKTLDVHFPHINWNGAFGTAALLKDVTQRTETSNGFVVLSSAALQQAFENFTPFHHEIEKHPNIVVIKQLLDHVPSKNTYCDTDVIAYFLYNKDQAVDSVEEAYFKLQCLSQLHVKPHELSLDGLFGTLHNVAWTNLGPVLPEDLSIEQVKATLSGSPLSVTHVDKFPYMVNYHVPNGVRIASGSQVRLGAYLSPGTTVMPAGYVNFNAGTLGNAMIEGRVSAGVVIGRDSDVGGGASIMGTLSGGNKNVISIGDKCLLGANAGTGISLGFGCTVAAGVYVTGSSKVRLYNADKEPIDINNNVVLEGKNIVKGARLNGKSHLLFIQDTSTGYLICRPNPKTIELNETLHA